MKQDMRASLGLDQRPSLIPQLTAHLLRLPATELAAELAAVAEQNPALELPERALPVVPQRGPTLRAHLLDQLASATLDDAARADAEAVAGETDTNGRLPSTPTLRKALGLSARRIEAAAATVQALDPAGVGARDLRECLLLQLRALEPSKTVADAAVLVRDHFADLVRRRLDRLPRADQAAALAQIASLQPRVGADFADQAAPAAAELLAFKRGGLWRVELLDEPDGLQLAAAPASGGGPQWNRLLRAGSRMVDALAFRRKTLLAVAQAAVGRQRGYFERGPAALRPLPLAAVAADTGLAVSTVSTAAAGKHLRCPHGVIALKYLFQRTARGRKDFSAAALRTAIKQVVTNENSAKPLSDAAIAQQLAAGGGSPARRTVAKHRAAAGIMPASLRRRT